MLSVMHDDLRELEREQRQRFVHAWEWVFGYTPQIEDMTKGAYNVFTFKVEGFWWRYRLDDEPYLKFVQNEGPFDANTVRRPRDLESVLKTYERNQGV